MDAAFPADDPCYLRPHAHTRARTHTRARAVHRRAPNAAAKLSAERRTSVVSKKLHIARISQTPAILTIPWAASLMFPRKAELKECCPCLRTFLLLHHCY
ncbi:unnamed protein product [Danaus chrysippus]|uniref:(African queen) hypothetical protein n=1 Tax=Danaus chrysippus TaxID=151541 RepID=A0A8J2W0G0_9NEOP|nr:unnamed protein product [Danaus chrysippus]